MDGQVTKREFLNEYIKIDEIMDLFESRWTVRLGRNLAVAGGLASENQRGLLRMTRRQFDSTYDWVAEYWAKIGSVE